MTALKQTMQTLAPPNPLSLLIPALITATLLPQPPMIDAIHKPLQQPYHCSNKKDKYYNPDMNRRQVIMSYVTALPSRCWPRTTRLLNSTQEQDKIQYSKLTGKWDFPLISMVIVFMFFFQPLLPNYFILYCYFHTIQPFY